ncbi:MAG: NAD(P)/FAD-dependent oxidoreductase [Gemmatimonadales bacterium]|nr:NAD(P)/FAD-dependent oxidoreductase [Gemmatimonadales bacterium]
MKRIVILGAGTAGTIMANRLSRLYRSEIKCEAISITIVDQESEHLYQPGLLFIPFGVYQPSEIVRRQVDTLPDHVTRIQSGINRVLADTDEVELANGQKLAYDVLIIATGTEIAPEETDGLTGPGWCERMFEFYTLDGAVALGEALEQWEGGRLVVDIVDMPIKCPVAPLEFAFLADWYFTERGIRDKVDITYVTPLDSAFTKPTCAKALTHLLTEKGVKLVTEFNAGEVDGKNGRLVSWDERVVEFDLLVSVPLHMGAEFIEHTPGLGDDQRFVLVDQRTLQAQVKPNIFAIGDATNVPASKAGSVAHFEAEILEHNVRLFLQDTPLEHGFDGHANCFIETGFKKALLIDFNYNVEPLPGKFPLPGIGPLPLLKESRLNHVGKMLFRWIYWNMLLPGRHIPGTSTHMSMRGKQPLPHTPEEPAKEEPSEEMPSQVA